MSTCSKSKRLHNAFLESIAKNSWNQSSNEFFVKAIPREEFFRQIGAKTLLCTKLSWNEFTVKKLYFQHFFREINRKKIRKYLFSSNQLKEPKLFVLTDFSWNQFPFWNQMFNSQKIYLPILLTCIFTLKS